jgi:bacterioferritin-associated ferredoxin
MVDRCICFDKTFADMKKIIEKHGIKSIYELRKHIPFGENCGLCLPFVEQLIKTGETKFEEINLDISNL